MVESAQSNVFRLLALSDQQSKTPKYFIYNDMKQRKAGNIHICEAGNSNLLPLLLVK